MLPADQIVNDAKTEAEVGYVLRKEKGIGEVVNFSDLYPEFRVKIDWANKLKDYFEKTQNNVGPADKVQPNEAFCHLELFREMCRDQEPINETNVV